MQWQTCAPIPLLCINLHTLSLSAVYSEFKLCDCMLRNMCPVMSQGVWRWSCDYSQSVCMFVFFLTREIMNGLTLNQFVFDVCVCFWIDSVDMRKGCTWEEFWHAFVNKWRFKSFDPPGVTLCGSQNVKVQLLTTLCFVLSWTATECAIHHNLHLFAFCCSCTLFAQLHIVQLGHATDAICRSILRSWFIYCNSFSLILTACFWSSQIWS